MTRMRFAEALEIMLEDQETFHRLYQAAPMLGFRYNWPLAAWDQGDASRFGMQQANLVFTKLQHQVVGR